MKIFGTKNIFLTLRNALDEGIKLVQSSVTPGDVLRIALQTHEGAQYVRALVKAGLSGAGGSRGYISIETRNSGGSFVEAFRIDHDQVLYLLGKSLLGYTNAITASTTQAQGQMALTKNINFVETVANANDVVTLPSAEPGSNIYISNAGANTLQVFPATGDSINAVAVNGSTTIASGASATFRTANSTNWRT
jgi:hypothetical protein